ncbi:MAG TPA: hypothetical protein DIC18_02605 [Clostridiales bacterium]|nr:hypothetical protein [Clostridiales bacterium]HCU56209.1 hypothetical protein [Clostridiales bacterium]
MAEIWECGLFRQIRIEFLVNAKINGSQGDAKITMIYKFVYDDDSCDIVRLIENVGWQEYLSNANKAKLQERKRDIVSE